MNLDFSWMQALQGFDHWTVLSAGRLRDFKPDNVFQFPIPNYLSLMVWSKLRYAVAVFVNVPTMCSKRE